MICRVFVVVYLFQHLNLVYRLLHTGSILLINLANQVVHIDDAVRQFRFGRLSHSLSQRDNLSVVGHQLLVACYVLVLLDLFQIVIEEEHLSAVLRHMALQLQFCLIVLAGIEGTDVPCNAGTNNAIQTPFAAPYDGEQPRGVPLQ